ncbi:MAG: TetR/AcrR family transcriptional regulator [Nitrospirales bacterium]|nr:TetR/AcrR family transcriptional regulator [Nitrospirales bacterium]
MKQKGLRTTKREQLIQAALPLFAKNGIHATGIDTIVEHSGVTKKTLYAHFRSKEELVLAALRHYDGQFRNSFMLQVERKARTPKTRLLAIFDVAETWFSQQSFYGCLFINAVGEHSAPDTSLRYVCSDFKRMMTEFIFELCIKMKARNPQQLAEELAILLEGAIVTAQVSQKPNAAKIAKRAASVLIEKQRSHEPHQE